jgi:hypothetical protein
MFHSGDLPGATPPYLPEDWKQKREGEELLINAGDREFFTDLFNARDAKLCLW